jgi:hypothetical protein
MHLGVIRHASHGVFGSASIAAALWLLAAGARTSFAQPVPAGPAFLVNQFTTGDQNKSRIAAADDGSFVIVWEGRSPNGSTSYGVRGRRYDSSGWPASAEFLVAQYTTGFDVWPTVSGDGTGSFVVVWQRGFNPANVLARRFTAGGAGGNEFQLNTASTSGLADGVLQPNGHIVGVWSAPDGPFPAYDGVFSRIFDDTDLPVTSQFQVNTYTTLFQSSAQIGRDEAGNFTIVWSSGNSVGSNPDVIVTRRYDPAGSALSGENLVNTYTTDGRLGPSITVARDGSHVVAWFEVSDIPGGNGRDGSGSGVYARCYGPDGTALGSEFLVNDYTTSSQYGPWMAADADGRYIVTWAGASAADTRGVYGKHYDSSCAALTPDFVVSADTSFDESDSAVATDEFGNFVVTWSSVRFSSSPDGHWRAVMARRFITNPVLLDDFQSGNLSKWSPASEIDSGDLGVSGAAGLKGTSMGLQVAIDDLAPLYALDETPAAESDYSGRFWFDPNGVDPGVGAGHLRLRIALLMQDTPVARNVALVLRRRPDGQYSILARVRRDNGTRANTGFTDITDAPISSSSTGIARAGRG